MRIFESRCAGAVLLTATSAQHLGFGIERQRVTSVKSISNNRQFVFPIGFGRDEEKLEYLIDKRVLRGQKIDRVTAVVDCETPQFITT